MNWIVENLSDIIRLVMLHLVQSIVPVVFGLLFSVPIARLAFNRGNQDEGARNVVRNIVVNAAGLLYTIPSLALFVLMPIVLGTSIISMINVIVVLTIYVVAILVRSAVEAFESVPVAVLDSAKALGYRPVSRFWLVELPLAVPVLLAGLRVAMVSNISMVSVGAIIGIESLGTLFTDGLRRNIPEAIWAGIVAIIVLSVLLDRLIALAGARVTRWRRA